jgi:hypothetical protein
LAVFFTAFFAAFFAITLAGRAFFFATGRIFALVFFFDLLFFAMIHPLLAFDPTTHHESSPEKVRCHQAPVRSPALELLPEIA